MTDNRDENTPHRHTDEHAVADEEYDPHAEYEPYVVNSTRTGGVAHHVHTTLRPDWNPGSPCPQCGSRLIVSSFIGTEIARHRGGKIKPLSAGDRFGVIEYQCADCETVLYEDAAFDLWTTLHLD
jgi:hypothetical protein